VLVQLLGAVLAIHLKTVCTIATVALYELTVHVDTIPLKGEIFATIVQALNATLMSIPDISARIRSNFAVESAEEYV
jgi:hypothetical protein